jgi:hypothetical protein
LTAIVVVADSQEAAEMAQSRPAVVDTHVLSETGSTRGTAYAMSNKVVTLGSRTHVAWLDRISRTMVATYDNEKGQWLGTWLVGEGLDNHGGPALTVDSGGYLHVVFGPHHGDFQYFRSARPNDASEWTSLGVFGARGTYPSLVCDSRDTLHVTYRGLGTPWQLAYQRRSKGGDWSVPIAIVDAAVPDGYTQYGNALCVGPDDCLHLVFHIYDMHPAAGKAAGYLTSPDGGDSWMLADGTPVELPFTPEKPGWVEQGPELDLRVGNVQLSPEGLPYFTVGHYKSKPGSTALWHWDGQAWRSTALSPVVRELLPGAHTGHGTLTFDESGGLWIALQASENGAWGDPTSAIVLLYSADRGKTFEAIQVASGDEPKGNWLPSIERPTGHNRVTIPHLLYTNGEPGETCTDPIDTEVRSVTFRK